MTLPLLIQLSGSTSVKTQWLLLLFFIVLFFYQYKCVQVLNINCICSASHIPFPLISHWLSCLYLFNHFITLLLKQVFCCYSIKFSNTDCLFTLIKARIKFVFWSSYNICKTPFLTWFNIFGCCLNLLVVFSS